MIAEFIFALIAAGLGIALVIGAVLYVIINAEEALNTFADWAGWR